MSNLSLGLPLLPTASSGSNPHQQMQLQQQQLFNQLKLSAMFNMDPNTAALMNAIAASYPPVSAIGSSVQGLTFVFPLKFDSLGILSNTAGSSNALYQNVLAAHSQQHQHRQSTKLSGVDTSHQSPPMKVSCI
jgi:hypothetical protein